MEYILYGCTIVALAVLGTVSARAGGSNVFKAVLRIVLGGTIAMVISAAVGYFFGVRV
jgi:VIT1/CCC1 family predicted Fe2+/Mn2+ transporter